MSTNMSREKAYAILGIKSTAKESEIKAAYRKLALSTHPDKNLNDPEATHKFREVTEAYKCLTDPPEQASSRGGFPSFSDEEMRRMFRMMFMSEIMRATRHLNGHGHHRGGGGGGGGGMGGFPFNVDMNDMFDDDEDDYDDDEDDDENYEDYDSEYDEDDDDDDEEEEEDICDCPNCTQRRRYEMRGNPPPPPPIFSRSTFRSSSSSSYRPNSPPPQHQQRPSNRPYYSGFPYRGNFQPPPAAAFWGTNRPRPPSPPKVKKETKSAAKKKDKEKKKAKKEKELKAEERLRSAAAQNTGDFTGNIVEGDTYKNEHNNVSDDDDDDDLNDEDLEFLRSQLKHKVPRSAKTATKQQHDKQVRENKQQLPATVNTGKGGEEKVSNKEKNANQTESGAKQLTAVPANKSHISESNVEQTPATLKINASKDKTVPVNVTNKESSTNKSAKCKPNKGVTTTTTASVTGTGTATNCNTASAKATTANTEMMVCPLCSQEFGKYLIDYHVNTCLDTVMMKEQKQQQDDKEQQQQKEKQIDVKSKDNESSKKQVKSPPTTTTVEAQQQENKSSIQVSTKVKSTRTPTTTSKAPSISTVNTTNNTNSNNSKSNSNKVKSCWYFSKGQCKDGDKCKYTHDISDKSTLPTISIENHVNNSNSSTSTSIVTPEWNHSKLSPEKKPNLSITTSNQEKNATLSPQKAAATVKTCRFFVKGNCKDGASCKFLHTATIAPTRGTLDATMPTSMPIIMPRVDELERQLLRNQNNNGSFSPSFNKKLNTNNSSNTHINKQIYSNNPTATPPIPRDMPPPLRHIQPLNLNNQQPIIEIGDLVMMTGNGDLVGQVIEIQYVNFGEKLYGVLMQGTSLFAEGALQYFKTQEISRISPVTSESFFHIPSF